MPASAPSRAVLCHVANSPRDSDRASRILCPSHPRSRRRKDWSARDQSRNSTSVTADLYVCCENIRPPCQSRLGRCGTATGTGRDSRPLLIWRPSTPADERSNMRTRAPDAEHVAARGGDVESLHERGVTWVSFKPLPGLACGIDFTLRKFGDLGLVSGTLEGVRHAHARRDSRDG